MKRSLWIRVLEAVENNLQDGLWRKTQDMGKLFRLSQPMVEIKDEEPLTWTTDMEFCCCKMERQGRILQNHQVEHLIE